jgi:hypothetical protein
MIDKPALARNMFEQLKSAGAAPDDAVRRMEFVALVLDSAFVLPGTNRRVGVDAIIGLVPGIGDVVTTVLSSYVIWEARNLGVSRWALGKMLANLAIHASVGSIPVFGDIFDALFRVNQRNMKIVNAELRNGKNARVVKPTTITVR